MVTPYFIGRSERGRFTIPCDRGKGELECIITDYWRLINATNSACGAEVRYDLTTKRGLSQTDTHELETVIEGTLGAESIAQLKSSIKETVRSEIKWEIAAEDTQSFSFTAPECGRQMNAVYQLVREYELRFVVFKRLFRRERRWVVALSEYLPEFHVQPNIDKWSRDCGCDDPTEPESDGCGTLRLERVGLQVPYWQAISGMQLAIPDAEMVSELTPSGTALLRVPVASLPSVVVWLGGLEGEVVTGLLSLAGESEIPVRSSTARARSKLGLGGLGFTLEDDEETGGAAANAPFATR